MLMYEVELVLQERHEAAVVRGHVALADLPTFLGEAFGEVIRALGGQQLTPAGPPFGRYRPTADGFDVEAGFPTSRQVAPVGRVVPIVLPGGPTARVLHRGSYETIAAAYEAVQRWLSERGYVAAGEPWESYLDGPEVPEPRTIVSFPCRPA